LLTAFHRTVFDRLLQASHNEDDDPFAKAKFRYQRTTEASKRTVQRRRKEERVRESAAARCRPLTSYFHAAQGLREDHHALGDGSQSCEEEDAHPEESKVDDTELSTELRDLAIQDLKKKLASKKVALKGQNATRHRAVLQFLYHQHRLEEEGSFQTRLQISQAVAKSFNRGKWFAEKIVTWERTWISSRYIQEGKQGCYLKTKSWFNDEGVLLSAREYISGAGERMISNFLSVENDTEANIFKQTSQLMVWQRQ
jgi:hypothetical protein